MNPRATRTTALRLAAAPIEVLPGPGGPIRTARLTLRALVAADRDSFLEAVRQTRAELDRQMPLHLEGESDEAMFERQLALSALGPARDWRRFLAVLEDGAVAGGVNLSAISRGLSWRADVNWWIARAHAGRGLATEAVGAAARYATAPLADEGGGLGLTELHAWITRDNGASVRIAEKAGFVRAGEERSYLLTDSRRWVLHDLYVLRAS